jgi:hypothetical protein
MGRDGSGALPLGIHGYACRGQRSPKSVHATDGNGGTEARKRWWRQGLRASGYSKVRLRKLLGSYEVI